MRPHHQGATHGDHLAFAAGQGPGPLLQPLAELGEDAHDELEPLGVLLGPLIEPHLKVFFDRQAGEDVVILRNHPHAPVDELVRLQSGDIFAHQQDLTIANFHLTEDRLQQRRLTGTVRADDTDQFALAGSQGAPVQDVHAR